MLRQLLVGAAVSFCTIGIHACVMAAVIQAARIAGTIATPRRSQRLIAVMIATMSVLMASHLAEVLVWSLAYAIVDSAPPGTDLVYFAFVNYTTLGYGDVTPVERWRLLGPMTAMNGVLLFGWSTAVIFEVLLRTIRLGGQENIAGEPGPFMAAPSRPLNLRTVFSTQARPCRRSGCAAPAIGPSRSVVSGAIETKRHGSCLRPDRLRLPPPRRPRR